jgi:hypothetical protein
MDFENHDSQVVLLVIVSGGLEIKESLFLANSPEGHLFVSGKL